jgi:predicted HAD superfamily Cof-like phosphohydrolase
MQYQLTRVQEFRTKHGFVQRELQPSERLVDIGTSMLGLATLTDDVSFELIIEEAAEIVLAAGLGDRTKFIDGLGDLLYVVLGRALEYNVDIAEVFERIHRSNMTKQVSTERVSDKGDTYQPPYLGDL